jgi:hypothetical protein
MATAQHGSASLRQQVLLPPESVTLEILGGLMTLKA